VGFWRAFRSDELTCMTIENVQASYAKGLDIFLPRSKTDRTYQGRHYKVPALRPLCPVSAFFEWINLSGLTSGPVFPGINQWGTIAPKAVHPTSVITIIKNYCIDADFDNAHAFSSHSLRRGFASWANANQWDTKTLMAYVGWKDVKSAMRYIDAAGPVY